MPETDAAGRKILHRAGNAKLARLDQAFDRRTFAVSAAMPILTLVSATV
jgi:hypothetical protein